MFGVVHPCRRRLTPELPCADSRRDLGRALAEVDLGDTVDARLARALLDDGLDDGLDDAIDRVFLAAGAAATRRRADDRPGHRPDHRPDGPPGNRRITGAACLAAAGMFLTCRMCDDYTSPAVGAICNARDSGIFPRGCAVRNQVVTGGRDLLK
jgi:hypothetical protein